MMADDGPVMHAVGPLTYLSCSILLFIFAYLILLLEHSIGSYLIALCIACIGVYVAAKLIPRGRVDPQGRAVFITGCDTGFGNALAHRLDKLGFKVFAGCLASDGVDARRLISQSSTRLSVVPCDVTSEVSIRSAREFVTKCLSESKEGLQLYAIVNNAGIWRWSEVEWASMEMYNTLHEVNVNGVIRATKAFLPIIRRNKGRIVNVGSLCGWWTTPCNAPYCMTKYAIECFSNSLRYEMHKWGVKVVIIEPGQYGGGTAIKTCLDGYADRLWQDMDKTCKEDYGRDCVDAWQKFMEKGIANSCPDISPVVDNMIDAVTSTQPKHRYLVGGLRMTYFEAYWNMMLPSWLTDRQYIRLGESVATPTALAKLKSP